MAALLRIQGLSVGYRSPILSGIDLELHPGELVCLLGPNGAGKSTLLRTLAGLQPALAGRLSLDGEDAASLTAEAWARKAAIVLTERVEAGNLSVYALAALGRHPFTGWTGRLRPEDRDAVRRGLEEAGAWELRDRPFDELSDGEKQRVMLARALAQEPSLLLLDEPTAFLDLPRRVETMRSLRRLARERGRAVLLSTHDLDLAMRASDRLWLLPPGGPVQSGLPEELALQGAIGKVFDQGDVAFDLATGQFRIHGHPLRKAILLGDPTLVFWTTRVLEREGFEVAAPDGGEVIGAAPDIGAGIIAYASAPAALRIAVGFREGLPYWDCGIGDTSHVLASLSDLVGLLRG